MPIPESTVDVSVLADGGRRFGVVSTFPPTECGIATFSAALTAGLVANGASVDVVRCGASPRLEDASVVGSLSTIPAKGRLGPIDVLNATDVVIVQHEYGIYTGVDGAGVLDVMDQLTVPVIVVAHTVLATPTTHQRWVLEQVLHAADAVVVMTETAKLRLAAAYDVNIAKVIVIPHGAATPAARDNTDGAERSLTTATSRAPRILTWGLLGPGKGIEWAIDAVAELTDLDPAPRYVIAGATHPKVFAHSGEAYREMLVARAAASPAAALISFDDTYRDLASLTELIRSADLVVLPYDSVDQVTSGVLVDAVAAGRPVVSTAFPHAVELLSSGAGIVVPQRDREALADAIRAVLTDPARSAAMSAEARRLAPELSWNAVAGRYSDAATSLIANRAAKQ